MKPLGIEPRSSGQKPILQRHLLPSIFGGIAISLIGFAAFFATKSIVFLQRSQPTQAVISKVLVRGTTINKRLLVEATSTEHRGDYYPVLRYVVDGREFSFRQKVSEDYAPSVGEIRPILVSTKDPSEARTPHFALFWLAPTLLFVFAVPFGLGAYILRQFAIGDAEQKEFLLGRAPRIRSSILSIENNILDRSPPAKRSRYLCAEFEVGEKVFKARSEPIVGEIVLPNSVTIAYHPDDPEICTILDSPG